MPRRGAGTSANCSPRACVPVPAPDRSGRDSASPYPPVSGPGDGGAAGLWDGGGETTAAGNAVPGAGAPWPGAACPGEPGPKGGRAA